MRATEGVKGTCQEQPEVDVAVSISAQLPQHVAQKGSLQRLVPLDVANYTKDSGQWEGDDAVKSRRHGESAADLGARESPKESPRQPLQATSKQLQKMAVTPACRAYTKKRRVKPVCAVESVSIDASPDDRCVNSSTALHDACEQTDEIRVKLLLGVGFPVNRRDCQGCTPLFTAVRAGASTKLLQRLIDSGAEPDGAPPGDPTPLMLAAGMGCLSSVQLLATAGADLFASADSLEGQSALHLAAANGCTGVVRLLLKAGFWPSVLDARGRTPLAAACANGRTSTASMLLSGEGWALPYMPTERDLPLELRQHVLSFLVSSPDTPNVHDGNSSLLEACNHRGTPDVLQLLATHGANFSSTNYLKETILHVICRRGNAELARYLLISIEALKKLGAKFTEEENSVDLHARDGRGRRAGEVKDIDVGVHEAMAIKDVLTKFL